MYSNKSTIVSKAQALGLMSYLTLNTEYQCTMSSSRNFVDVSAHCDTLAEVQDIENIINKFSVDGCAIHTHHNEDFTHFWVIIEFPTCFTF